MAQIELPDRGQPLDISYLYRIVNEINNVSSLIGNSLSKIKYKDSTTPSQILTSNLVFYAESLKLTDANLSTQTSVSGTFNYSGIFKTTPVVVCSVTAITGESKLYAVLNGINQNQCKVDVYSPTTSGKVDAEVSIIAIGQRINS
jgi:hypothetical protein